MRSSRKYSQKLSQFMSNNYSKDLKFKGRAYFNVDEYTKSLRGDESKTTLLINEIDTSQIRKCPILLTHIGKDSSGNLGDGFQIGEILSAEIDGKYSLIVTGVIDAPFSHLVLDGQYKSLSIGYNRFDQIDSNNILIGSKKYLREISLCNTPVIPGCSLIQYPINNSTGSTQTANILLSLETMSTQQPTEQSTAAIKESTIIETKPTSKMPETEEEILQFLKTQSQEEKDKIMAKSIMNGKSKQVEESKKEDEKKKDQLVQTQKAIKASLQGLGVDGILDEPEIQSLSQHPKSSILVQSYLKKKEEAEKSNQIEMDNIKKGVDELKKSNETLKRSNEELAKFSDTNKRKKVDEDEMEKYNTEKTASALSQLSQYMFGPPPVSSTNLSNTNQQFTTKEVIVSNSVDIASVKQKETNTADELWSRMSNFTNVHGKIGDLLSKFGGNGK